MLIRKYAAFQEEDAMLNQLLIPILATLQMVTGGTIRDQDKDNRQAAVQSEFRIVTLLPRAKQKNEGYGQSAFSFRYGIRSDNDGWLQITGNNYDLLYGNITLNYDSDWFCVSMGGPELSRIKDLGKLEWSEIYEAPILETPPRAPSGVRMPERGESYEESSEGRLTKAVEGHIYLVHTKNDRTDHYAMFRVEMLEPSKSCRISWKLVPSPENATN
jgi:hypothetical protein